MSRRRRSKRPKSHIKTSVLLILATCVAAVLIFVPIYLKVSIADELPINRSDFCPVGGPIYTVSILLDITDDVSATTKTSLMNRVEKVLSSLPKYANIKLYTFSENGLSQEPIQSVCSPGNITNSSEYVKQGIIANPKIVRDRFKSFKDRFSLSLNEMLNEEMKASQTPIMSAIQTVSLLTPEPIIYGKKSQNGVSEKNIIVVISDMLEHTSEYSVYRNGLSLEVFKKGRSPQKFGINLDKTILRIWLISRDDNYSNTELFSFWKSILSISFNTELDRLTQLPGEN